ncbi:protein bicaudal C homolog 1 [Tetranychus urticae]|uniref:SAM domain-containing protein n=1 Tax=Tetranychus urticae TaxID=32264 RepID=T1KUJ0_TETUR|nr:protein bicaudal C homolog 1 [Tetranychus urticae]
MDSASIDSNSNTIDEASNVKSESTSGSFEERVKVDRKKFEQIINGENKELGSAEEFFNEIMAETNTIITWPMKLKPGTKSKKDPHIRITGAQEDILNAKDKILDHLDSRKNRVTLKMDVAYTDHSHIIGKGGRSIQKVMNETGCHIHFPDSNRTNTIDKSNQVSIAGTALGAEQARCRIRELLPLSVHFELPIAGYNKMEMFDHTSPAIQTIQQTYGISINIRIIGKSNVFGNFGSSCASYASISVRGTRAQWLAMKQGIAVLIEYLCGHPMTNNSPTILFTLVIDIASQHHSFVMGRGNVNIRSIMQSTGVVINFPDPVAVENTTMTTLHGSLTVRKSTVMIKGPCFDSVVLAWQELLGYLPLVLIFDLKEGQQTDAALITQLMKDYEVTILIKQKPKQNSGRCMTVRGAERDSRMLFEVRRQILELDESEVPNCCDKHTIMMMAKLFSSLIPHCTLNPTSMMTMKGGFGSALNPSGCLPNNGGLGGQVNGLLNWPSNDYSSVGNFPSFAAAAAAAAASTNVPSQLGPNGFLQAMLATQLTNFAAAAAANQQQQQQISAQPNTPSFNIDMLKNSSDNRNGNGCIQSAHNLMSTSTTPTMNQSCLTTSSMNSPNSGSETSAPSPLDLSPPPNRSLSAIFGNFSVSDKSTAFPWPEPRKLDYDERKYLAAKAVREAKPKASEPRTPTPSWAGFGFSKSMPHELLKSRLDSCRATEKLTPVEESPDELNNPNNSLLTNSSLTNDMSLQSSFWESTKYPTSNGLKTLRKQQSFDFSTCTGSLSLGSSMPSSSSLFSNSSNSSSNLFDPISSSSRSKSGSISSGYGSPASNSLDLAEVLTRLGLAKYIDYFQRADIDFNTFLNFNDADLEELGIPYFGRRKLSSAILDCKRALREQGSLSPFNHFEAAPGAERSRKVKNIV